MIGETWTAVAGGTVSCTVQEFRSKAEQLVKHSILPQLLHFIF